MPKFKTDQRFTLGPLTGKVIDTWNDAYAVAFDGNTYPESRAQRVNRFNADFFDSVAEVYTPDNRDLFDELEIGQEFTFRHYTMGGKMVKVDADRYLVVGSRDNPGPVFIRRDDMHRGTQSLIALSPVPTKEYP